MSNEYLLSLCREYVDLVNNMRSGQYTTEEIHTLDSERQLTHNSLCDLTGYPHSADMYRIARMLLRDGGYDV